MLVEPYIGNPGSRGYRIGRELCGSVKSIEPGINQVGGKHQSSVFASYC